MTIHLSAAERPLSPTEFIVWAADETCPLNFSMHFELHGPLDENQLRAALLQVQAMHPLLRVRMVDEGRHAWFRTHGVGSLPLRIVDGPPTCLATEAEYEVQTRFDCQRGPLARCVWIRHATDHATLLVTFQHVIGDGTSGALLIRELLRALAGERLTALPLAESLDGHLPPLARGLRGLMGYLRTSASIGAWIMRKGRPRGLPVETRAELAQQQARLSFMRFDAAFLQALTSRARAEGTTVHGALAAAIVLSGQPELAPGPRGKPAHVMFCSPINMRDRLEPPIGDDIGFYITGGCSSHLVDAQREFWPLARELKQGLNASIDAGQPFFGLTGLAPSLVLLHRLNGGGARGMRAATRGLAGAMQESFGLTNIGRVKIEPRYGALTVSAVGFVASPSAFCSNLFFAAAHGDTLTLNYAVMEPLISRATQQRVAERMHAILAAAVAAQPV